MKGDCNICANGKLPSDSAICVGCGLSRKNYKPITHYDLLISKTPEEMAELIAKWAFCDECVELFGYKVCETTKCSDHWLLWLKSPVEPEGRNDGKTN